MDTNTHCQSCGMPFNDIHRKFIAPENDGSDSVYCRFCYQDGRFLNPTATVEDMIENGVPHFAGKLGRDEAREYLTRFLPTLARWQNQ